VLIASTDVGTSLFTSWKLAANVWQVAGKLGSVTVRVSPVATGGAPTIGTAVPETATEAEKPPPTAINLPPTEPDWPTFGEKATLKPQVDPEVNDVGQVLLLIVKPVGAVIAMFEIVKPLLFVSVTADVDELVPSVCAPKVSVGTLKFSVPFTVTVMLPAEPLKFESPL
jgi:hypothetical protein